jgi:DNA-binding transcriptional ArsR family regulator/REP element-mobilizing transposase RayT
MQIDDAISKASLQRQAKVMKALAHPSRLLIVHTLMNGEHCVCELRDLLGQDISTVSRHLSVLKNAGLLTEDKRGLYVFYTLTAPCLGEFFACFGRITGEKDGSVGDVALPPNAEPTGRASSPNKPLPPPNENGSVGDVALPPNAKPTGRASSPNKPLPPPNENGSVGDVALPNNSDPQGRESSPNEPLPKRKKLPHEIPSWVQQGTKHFITINCKDRGSDPLIDHAALLLKSAAYYEQTGRWYLWLMVVMPDHIHFIATFDLSMGIKNTVSAWKRYQKKTLGIDWQAGFFEHRLRNGSEFDEKAHYIRMNPVRKGLAASLEQWPHVLDRTAMDGGSPGDVALTAKPTQPNDFGSVGDVALPEKNTQPNDCGSAGGIALPPNAEPTGRASSPNEPLPRPNNNGSAGDVALPPNVKSPGRASSPNEPLPRSGELSERAES